MKKSILLTVFSFFIIFQANAKWEEVFRPKSGRFLNSNVLKLFKFKNDLLLITSKGILFSKDTGNTWEVRDTTLGYSEYSAAVQNDSTLYLGLGVVGLYISNDTGRTFKEAHYLAIPLGMAYYDKKIFIHETWSIKVSNNEGKTFYYANDPAFGAPKNYPYGYYIYQDELYLNYGGKGFKRNKKDTVWRLIKNGIPLTRITHKNKLYYTSINNIYESKDSFATFKRIAAINTTINTLGSDSINLYAIRKKDGVIFSNDEFKNINYIRDPDSILATSCSWGLRFDKYIILLSSAAIYRYNMNDFVTNIDINKKIRSENDITDKLDIFPNPAKNEINVDISNFNKPSIYIYDNLGKLFYSSKDNLNDLVSINTSNFSNGIYYLKIVSSNSKSNNAKFIIQK